MVPTYEKKYLESLSVEFYYLMSLKIEDQKPASESICTKRGDRKNRNLPKSPLKSGVGGDMGFGGAGRGKVGYVCVKVGWVLIT